jgi:ABC-type branched-subunit amino acid transport system ATPase component
MTSADVLAAESIEVGYGAVAVVRDVSLHVAPGEVVVLLGPNGAGKTTTVKALAGVLPLMSGVTRLRGEPSRASLHVRARAGVAYVPEERAIISKLSVADNLRLGMGTVDDAFAIFPQLERLRSRKAGLISGGEQRMLVLARALAAHPSVVLADELSLGLAPLIVRRLLDTLRTAADDGAGVLLVEQHARQALQVADRAYVLQRGSLVWQGSASEARSNIDELEGAYLGH